MSPDSIDPVISNSFRFAGSKFVSRNPGGFYSCPPRVIARIVRDRIVEGAHLELPEGYSIDTFDTIAATTGFVETDVDISLRQAAELAITAWNLQELNESGQVQPPIDRMEHQHIAHLLASVTAMSFEGMKSYEISEADIAYIAAASQLINSRS